MVSAAQGLGFDAQVHLQMTEKVDIFSGLEGNKRSDAAHRSGNEDHLLAGLWTESLLHNLRAHLAHVVLRDSVHLVRGAVQVAVLPLELRSSGVVFSVIFTTSWQSVDVEVLELVNASNCVMVKQTE